MSKLLEWFENDVKPTINRARARNYANFVTSVLQLEDLVKQRAPVSCFIQAFEKMQPEYPQGYESKPGVINVRRRFDWVNGRGFLDLSQAVNGTRRPYAQNTLLIASVYHIPSRAWHSGAYAECEDVTKKDITADVFPFPSQQFHSFSFAKKPNFYAFVDDHPDIVQTLQQMSVQRRTKEMCDVALGQCFVRRVVRGSSLNNIAFPHL